MLNIQGKKKYFYLTVLPLFGGIVGNVSDVEPCPFSSVAEDSEINADSCNLKT